MGLVFEFIIATFTAIICIGSIAGVVLLWNMLIETEEKKTQRVLDEYSKGYEWGLSKTDKEKRLIISMGWRTNFEHGVYDAAMEFIRTGQSS